MDEKDLDKRAAIDFWIEELNNIIPIKAKIRDSLEAIKRQYHKDLNLNPGQYDRLKRLYERFTS